MMSEDMYVTWFKPRLKKIIDTVKAVNPDIIIFYHSCGFVTPFIPHLIEAGVDVLNPVQSECMSFEEIQARMQGVFKEGIKLRPDRPLAKVKLKHILSRNKIPDEEITNYVRELKRKQKIFCQ